MLAGARRWSGRQRGSPARQRNSSLVVSARQLQALVRPQPIPELPPCTLVVDRIARARRRGKRAGVCRLVLEAETQWAPAALSDEKSCIGITLLLPLETPRHNDGLWSDDLVREVSPRKGVGWLPGRSTVADPNRIEGPECVPTIADKVRAPWVVPTCEGVAVAAPQVMCNAIHEQAGVGDQVAVRVRRCAVTGAGGVR